MFVLHSVKLLAVGRVFRNATQGWVATPYDSSKSKIYSVVKLLLKVFLYKVAQVNVTE